MQSPNETLFRLECVLLFALDVVKGPYIHSCAPANPPEIIRSFLQAPASATLPTPALPLQRTDAFAEDSLCRTLASSISRKAATAGPAAAAGTTTTSGGGKTSDSAAASLPQGGNSSFPHTSGFLGHSTATASVAAPVVSSSSSSPSQLANATPPPSGSINAGYSAAGTPTTVSTTRPISSSLLAQHRLLSLGDTTSTATPDDSRGSAMGTSAPRNTSVSEDNNTLFAISPQTNLSESQQTLPSESPMAGSFVGVANTSMTSNAGGGCGASGPTSGATAAAAARGRRESQTAGPLTARPSGAADDDESGHGAAPLPLRVTSASSSPQMHGTAVAGSSVQTNVTSVFHSDADSTPLATPVQTPPIAASSANPGMAPEPLPSSRASHYTDHHHGVVAGDLGGGAAGSSSRVPYAAGNMAGNGGCGVGPPTSTATEEGRINGYNDVFVPRSEFCRRVLWLYPAESGLLFLYYAEDIPGEHYQRKTLRYSLCLVFCVDKKRMTIGAGLLHQLVRPYSVVLTNIAEELREAEVKYAYMSRGLLAVATPRRPPASRQPTDASLLLPASASTAPSVVMTVAGSKAPTAASAATATAPTEHEEAESTEEDVAGRRSTTPTTAKRAVTAATTSSGSGNGSVASKTLCLGRRRVVSESSTRPDTYHLALVECSVPAAAAAPRTKDMSTGMPGNAKADSAAPESAEHVTPTSYMSPLPPNTPGSGAAGAEAAAEGAGQPPESGAATHAPTTSSTSTTPTADLAAKEAADSLGVLHASSQDRGSADAKTEQSPGVTAVATATASVMAGSVATSTSLSYAETSKATTGTTPSSQFGTPFSPPAAAERSANARVGLQEDDHYHDHHHQPNTSPANAAGQASHGSGGTIDTSSASAVSPALTEADALTITPPSSLPMRSRTVSQGAGAFQAFSSSAQSPALDDSLCTTGTAPSPLSSMMMASSGSGGVMGPFPSTASLALPKHPPPHPSSTASLVSGPPSTQHGSLGSQYRSGIGTGGFPGTHVSHNVNTLNAFITPTTAPQWTPLSELVEELYRCLRYGGDGDCADDGDASVCTSSTSATAAVPGKSWGGSLNGARSPKSAPAGGGGASMRRSSFATRPAASSAAKLAYNGGEVVAQAEGPCETLNSRALSSPVNSFVSRVAAPSFLSSSTQQQQRGDVSVVHLSDRLSFHVRRMAPLEAARFLHFDHVPVPIVAYDPAMLEWMDMAVHHVFRLVDGVRTVADLVFDVAMGTTTTLAEVYADALQRSNAMAAAEATSHSRIHSNAGGTQGGSTASNPAVLRAAAQGASVGSRDKTGGTTSRGSSVSSRPGAPTKRSVALPGSRGDAANASKEGSAEAESSLLRGSTTPSSIPTPAHTRVVAVPIDARLSLTLLPGVRYSIPTSAAAAAAAAAISDGQAPPPSFVNVRLTPSTPDPVFLNGAAASKSGDTAAGGAQETVAAASPPHIAVELPATWVATTGIVVEALLHLERCHLIKIYRPWTAETLYTATPTLQRVLRSIHHPARAVLAEYLLHVAWMERQQCRLERQAHRCSVAAAAQYKAKCAQQEPEQEQRGRPPLTEEQATSDGAAATLSVSNPSSTQAPFPTGHPPLKSTPLPPCLAAATGAKTAKKAGASAALSPSEQTAWLPAAVTISASSSSVSSALKTGLLGDTHAQQPLPSQPYHASPSVPSSGASSLPRPPPTSGSAAVGGGSGSGGGGFVVNSPVTHASSMSTSYAVSCSLKHTVSVGAAGRLQMNLTSSLPTSPMLRPGAVSSGGSGGSALHVVASPNPHCARVDGLPSPPADSSSLQHASHHHHPHERVYRLVGRGEDDTDGPDTSMSSSQSSSSSSSSTSHSSDDGRRRPGAGQRHALRTSQVRRAPSSSAPSSSSSSRTEATGGRRREGSQQASSPVSFKKKFALCGSSAASSSSSSPASSRAPSATPVTPASSSPSPPTSTDAACSASLPQSLPILLATSTLTSQNVAAQAANALREAAMPSAGNADAATPTASFMATAQQPQQQQRRDRGDHNAPRQVTVPCDDFTSAAPRASCPIRTDASLSDNTNGAPISRKAELGSAMHLGAENGVSRCRTATTATMTTINTAAGEKRDRKKSLKPLKQLGPSLLRVFVPTEAELTQAAAAALSALAKFSNTSVASVQAEMRRMPVWATTFNHWSERCVRAMVEVAVLNNWLEDVSQ